MLGAVVGLTTASAQQQSSNGTFNTIYHSDLPFFNQHNGPVLLFMDMQHCKPCRKWQINLYQANIERWRSWGVRFYHYIENIGMSENDPLPNEWKLNNEIAKILKNDMEVSKFPAALVFDGYGNCIYYRVGFWVEKKEELTAELNSALREALRRNGK